MKIVKEYQHRELHSQNITMKMPSIMMLNRFHKIPSQAKFTRKNMYIRDQHSCQYCGNQFTGDQLTIDHVLPRSKGGKINWENCVSACQPCNTRKGSKLLKPIVMPYAPSYYELNNKAKKYHIEIPDESWLDFINWPEECVTVRHLR